MNKKTFAVGLSTFFALARSIRRKKMTSSEVSVVTSLIATKKHCVELDRHSPPALLLGRTWYLKGEKEQAERVFLELYGAVADEAKRPSSERRRPTA